MSVDDPNRKAGWEIEVVELAPVLLGDLRTIKANIPRQLVTSTTGVPMLLQV